MSTPTPSPVKDEALAAQVASLETRLASLEQERFEDRISLVVFSGDMDKLLAAFTLATGAAAMGTSVSMFFTFWGLSGIKKQRIVKKKPFWDKVLALMLPRGADAVPTSRMNMAGMGPRFFKKMMKDKGVASLPELVGLAQDLDVEMFACQMSMDVMGVTREELLDSVDVCGVAGYLGQAHVSRNQLFI